MDLSGSIAFGYSKVYAEEAWSQIDVQLKRRNDLIPNLVETTKGYSKYEAGTLEKVTKLRTELNSIPDSDHAKKMEVSNELTGTLRTLFAVAENYPDLKASAEYQKLMEELTNTENKIAYSRQLFNSSAANFNQRLLTFPSNMGKLLPRQRLILRCLLIGLRLPSFARVHQLVIRLVDF